MRAGTMIVVAVGLLAASAWGNVLVNGDFDTGNLGPWVQYNAGTWMGAPGLGNGVNVWGPGSTTSGASCLQGAFGNNMVGGNAGVYQQVAVVPGVEYTLDFDVAGGIGGFGTFNGTGWWEVRFMDQAWDQNQIDSGPLLWKKELTTEEGFPWTHVSAKFTPTSPTIAVYAKYGGWDPQWDWMYFGAYYDSFVLVPEPASLLLIALGLPLLRRRRS